ncbi:hypothetical protein [Treponema phagedenis]|uniref:hypothetical protein n=1 Tax=Treponema phagedenis TaxID=162 RepID=UPI002090C255|nr:hypothetical protein [Treponema phagedenis]
MVKGIIAVQRGLRAMDAAFKVIGASNPFMLAIAGAAAAVVAIKELLAWMDRAAEKQFKQKLATIEANTATMVQAQRISELAKAYETLNQKEKLNAQEALRMKEIAKEINAITGQSLIMISQSTGKARIDVEASVEAAHDVADRKQEDLEHNKRVLSQLQSAESDLAKIVKEYSESTAWSIEEVFEKFALLPDSLKTVTNAKDGLRKTREEIAKLKIDITETERGIAALRDYSKESFVPELEPEQAVAPINETGKGKEKNEKTQAERLADLEKEYEAEVALIKKSIEDKKEQEELLLKNEESFYKKRLELLESFHKENVTKNLKENAEKNLTVEQSLAKAVGAAHETILEETKKTNEELDRLSDERHQKELEKIKKFTEEAKTDVELKVQLKVETGEITGATEKQLNRAEWQERANLYSQKRNELLDQYISLQKSSNKEDQEKAAAIKKQADNMGTLAEEAAKKASDAFAEATRKIADKFSEIGGIISSTFSQIADAAQGFINNKEEKRRQETAIRLAEIEREKNETLLEIDNELSEKREQKQIEDAEREEQYRSFQEVLKLKPT